MDLRWVRTSMIDQSIPDPDQIDGIQSTEYICTSQPVAGGCGSIPCADRVLLSLTVVTRNGCHLRETPQLDWRCCGLVLSSHAWPW